MKKRQTSLPDNWTDQAFKFKLDPTDATSELIRRHTGMRRKAHNWAIGVIKDQVELYNRREDAGLNLPRPHKKDRASKINPLLTLQGLRKLWNKEKPRLCVDADTGQQWWQELSKEAAANGIDDAVTAFWNCVDSKNGNRAGPRMGFPKHKKKGRCTEKYRISTGTIKFVDRRHIQLPRLGVVRLHENARRLDRLINKGLAKIKSATVTQASDGYYVSLQVEILRPQHNHKPSRPNSRVGIDLGTRYLAVVASSDGEILERIHCPAPLKQALGKLRRLQRKLARSEKDSRRYKELRLEIARTHTRVANVRRDFLHKLTARLAKTHGTIVIEDLCVKGMMQQKGPGSRARKRALADAGLGEFRRQLTYKCGWYGSELVIADRWFPSTQTCHRCSHRQKIGRAEFWVCAVCESEWHRDENAAINLARYGLSSQKVREGVQWSCCCTVCSDDEQTKRLRDIETESTPTVSFDGSGVSTWLSGSSADTRSLVEATP